jgi:HlyD family secretion protein
VDFNSQVKAGQVVAQIDPALFQATVTQAEGDLTNAQAALELAKLNATRTQELFAKKTSSRADVDQAIANLHQAEANVKIKQALRIGSNTAKVSLRRVSRIRPAHRLR